MRTLYLILFVVAGLAFAQQPPSPRPLTTAEAAALVEPVALGHRVLAALSHYFEVKIPRGPAGTGPTLLTSMPTLELLHVAACLNDSDFALSRHYRATLHTMLPNAPATQPVLSMRTDRGELFFDIGGNRTLQPSE
jgi:hypothetical protein